MELYEIEVVEERDDPYQMENAEAVVDMHSAPAVERVETKPTEIAEPQQVASTTPTTDKAIESMQSGLEKPEGLNPDELANHILDTDPRYTEVLKPYKERVDTLQKQYDEEMGRGDDNAEKTHKELEKAKEDYRKQRQSLYNSIIDDTSKNCNIIVVCFNTLRDGVSQLNDAVTTFMQSIAVPSTVVTGSAAGVPNPAYAALQGQTLKCQITTILGSLAVTATTLCYAAKALNYELPEVVTTAIQGIAVVKTALDVLP